MKRLVLALILVGLTIAAPCQAAVSLVTHAAAYAATGASNATTSGVDTSTAETIACTISSLEAKATPTINDNYTNTWLTGPPTTRSNPGAGNVVKVATYYCKNCSVGAGHTFTAVGADATVRQSIACAAFTGTDTSSPFDVENGATDITTGGINTGSITPTANAVAAAGLAFHANSATITIDSSYTITDQIDYNAGGNSNCGIALAYKVIASGSTNPKYDTGGASEYLATEIASFKQGGGGGGGGATPRRGMLLGVGL